MHERNSVFAAGCLVVVAVGLAACDGGQPANITVASYGTDSYRDAQMKTLVKPFEQETKGRVELVAWNAEYGRLAEMVSSGKVTWDVVDIPAGSFARGTAEGLFAKLTVRPTDGKFVDGAVTDFGVANAYWGTGIAFRKARFAGNEPLSWRDFWDVKKFPGPRALYNGPQANVEFALLASGVPTSEIYPLTAEKINRAFRKLEELRPYVRVWWTDGARPLDLLLNDSVMLSTVSNGRIFASEPARAQLRFVWDGAVLEPGYWVVPRGSVNVDAASRFIAFASKPAAMAKQAELVGDGPANLSAVGLVPEALRRELPTYSANLATSLVLNAGDWLKLEEQLRVRWLQFKGR